MHLKLARDRALRKAREPGEQWGHRSNDMSFLANLSAAVKDGVKEFSETAIHEVQQTVKDGTQTVVGESQKYIGNSTAQAPAELGGDARGREKVDEGNKGGERKISNSLKRKVAGRSGRSAPSDGSEDRSSGAASTSTSEACLDELATKIESLFAEDAEPSTRSGLRSEVESLVRKARVDVRKRQADAASLHRKLSSERREKENLRKESEALEDQVQDITRSLEAKLAEFKTQAQKKVAEAREARSEKEAVESAYRETKLALKQSNEERAQLTKRVTDLERDARDAMAMSRASTIAAREDLQGRVASANRLASENEKRAKEAEARLMTSEAAMRKAEEACAKAEASALESAKRAEASLSELEIERGSREEAQGQSEQLHKESQRRKAAFNHAVRAAVGGTERKLESENQRLYRELQSAEEKLEEERGKSADFQKVLLLSQQETEGRVRDAKAECAEAVKAQREAAQRASDMEAECERVKAECEAHEMARDAVQAQEKEAKEKLQDLQREITSLEDRNKTHERALSQVEALENELASTRSDLARSRKAEEIVQRQMESLKANQRTAETSGLNRQHSSDRVRELEKRLMEAEAKLARRDAAAGGMKPASSFGGGGVSSSFNLEKIVKVGSRSSSGSKHQESVLPLHSSRRTQGSGQRGQISLRTWLLVAYLVVLHIAVMHTFTSQHELELQCDQLQSHLP